MDELKAFLISLLANLTTDMAKQAIFLLKSSKDVHEEVLAVSTARGIIDLAADDGTIILDGGILEALNSIRCDHGTGQVSINQTHLKSAILHTGGIKPDSSGSTTISGTVLESHGTKISVGQGAFITMTGNASMHQS